MSKHTMTSLRLTEDERDAIQTRASELGIPMREVIMGAVRDSLGQKRNFDAEGFHQGMRSGIQAVMAAVRMELSRDFVERVMARAEKLVKEKKR